MGQQLNGREVVSVGDSDDERSVSVTGVGVPNVLLTTVCELERGDVLGARYQIEAVIGTGGSGRVLRAFDRESRMPVALKILRPEFASDPVWTERFSRELRIGRTITHPNVCRVFDIGDADGHKFLSMELASRGSIRADVPKLGASRVTPTRPLRSWAERVADAQAVVDGVAALHAAGIVHRDLKPENILRMEDGRLVVTDFGLATDPDAHGNTVMVGTPSYMAPEVVMGDPATKRSDVWGLGVVLHEILFGCRPQWKPAGRGYRKFVLPDEVATPVQRATAELCGRCADDTAELRPPSAVEARDELARALKGKRRLTRARTRQITWGVVAVAAFAALAVVRERWSNRAEASLSSAATPLGERVLMPTGVSADWRRGLTTVASLPGRLHCVSLVKNGEAVRAIWGTPKKAEDIEIRSGARATSKLAAETYEDGCPMVSPDGRSLLFERKGKAGNQIFLSRSATGDGAHQIIRGTAPQWLGNSDEFAFAVDSRHAAVFSIPTATMTIVSDEVKGPRLLTELAVAPSGRLLAVRYFTNSLENLLVVHSLPSTDPLAHLRVSASARQLQFLGNGELAFTMDGDDGTAKVVAIAGQSTQLHNVGAVKGSDVRRIFETPTARIIVTRRLHKDLWVRPGGGGELRALTADGESYGGDVDSSGRVLVQRRLADGRFVIVLRDPSGQERQLTQGHLDAAPTFGPDGTSWVYSNLDSGRLIECSFASNTCRVLHSDRLVPVFPANDPSGKFVAYVTGMGDPRLRVFSRIDGAERDLGPAGDTCPPYWSSTSRLWFLQSALDGNRTWAEMDPNTGKRTGMQRSIGTQVDSPCAVPDDLLQQRDIPVVVPREDSEIARVTL